MNWCKENTLVVVEKIMQFAITDFFLKATMCFLYTNWFIFFRLILSKR